MSPLAQAAFASLLATCAPDAPANYITAIARTESGLQPFAIHDNTTGKTVTPAPSSHKEAVGIARDLLKAGHNLDVGLLQVNTQNWNWLGLNVETALDPCRNVAAGAAVLQSFSAYNTGNRVKGFTNGYVQKVVAKTHGIQIEEPLPVPPKERHRRSVFVEADDTSRDVYSRKKRKERDD